MIVGVLREVKSDEYRVGLLPVGAELLVRDGHTVLVETAAGEGTGFENDRYLAVGAKIVESAAEVWGEAELKGYRLVFVRYNGDKATNTVMTYTSTPQGWKRTNALSAERTADVVWGAFRQGSVVAR